MILWPNGKITVPESRSEFGPRLHPVDQVWKNHNGLDLVGFSTVRSPVTGRVITAGRLGSAGNVVDVLEDGTGHVFRHFHLKSIAVRDDQRVTAGDPVGVMGATGKVTGVHLHFEVRVNGVPQNPRTYYASRPAPAPKPVRKLTHGGPMTIYLHQENGKTIATLAHNGGFARINYNPGPWPKDKPKGQYQNLIEAGVKAIWMDPVTVSELIKDARGANR